MSSSPHPKFPQYTTMAPERSMPGMVPVRFMWWVQIHTIQEDLAKRQEISPVVDWLLVMHPEEEAMGVRAVARN